MIPIKFILFIALSFITLSINNINAYANEQYSLRTEYFNHTITIEDYFIYEYSEPTTIKTISMNFDITPYTLSDSYRISYYDNDDNRIAFSNSSAELYTTGNRYYENVSKIIITLRYPDMSEPELNYINLQSIQFNDTYNKVEPPNNISNLNYNIANNDITFNYDIPETENFSHIELYQDGQKLVDDIQTNSIKITSLDYDTNYEFTFYVVDTDGNKSSGVTRSISIPENPNLLPSGDIFNLNHTVTDTSIHFTYNLPTDDRFNHLRVYRDNELLTDNYNLSEYTDRNLEPETEYHYRFVTVNKEGISSNGYSLTVKTNEEIDDTPPDAPTGLQITEMNSGLILSWHSNTETDLNGYNVYVNGEKHNASLIRSNSYNLTNLTNGTEYNLAVSAVDTSGNESELSTIQTGTPDEKEMPIFQLDTNLSAIGLSIENWFSEIWLLVAFSTAIPLSFIIAGRVKSLFIA